MRNAEMLRLFPVLLKPDEQCDLIINLICFVL